MSTVGVRIHGHEYHIACDDGQEEQLRVLSEEVDRRLQLLEQQMGGSPGEVKGLLLVALMMADEIIENKQQINDLAARVESIAARVEMR